MTEAVGIRVATFHVYFQCHSQMLELLYILLIEKTITFWEQAVLFTQKLLSNENTCMSLCIMCVGVRLSQGRSDFLCWKSNFFFASAQHRPCFRAFHSTNVSEINCKVL